MQNGCALNMRWKGLLIKQCMVLKGLLIKGLCTSSWDREFFISRQGVGGWEGLYLLRTGEKCGGRGPSKQRRTRIVTCILLWMWHLFREVQTTEGCQELFSCYFPPPSPEYIRVGGWGILESLCPSVVLSMCLIVSVQYLLNCSTIFTKLDMVVFYHEAMCH